MNTHTSRVNIKRHLAEGNQINYRYKKAQYSLRTEHFVQSITQPRITPPLSISFPLFIYGVLLLLVQLLCTTDSFHVH